MLLLLLTLALVGCLFVGLSVGTAKAFVLLHDGGVWDH